MAEIGSGLLCLVLFFGAAMGGLLLHLRLPKHHRHDTSHEVVRNNANMLVLASSVLVAFLITFMQADFEKAVVSVQGYATELTVLDDMLRAYGADAEPMRETLKNYAGRVLVDNWRAIDNPNFNDPEGERRIQQLSVAGLELDGRDHFHQGLAAELVNEIRLLALHRQQLIELHGSGLPIPFVALTVIWLMLCFASFGFNAPCNALTVGCLLVTTASMAAALYLIIDLSTPFSGPIEVSDRPIRNAIAHLQLPAVAPPATHGPFRIP